MLRLLGATLLATAEGASGPVVSFYCVNACDDGSQQDYCVNDSTAQDGCTTAPAGCHVMAWQTLYNVGTCEAFKASQPLCFGEGHGTDSGRCPEAANFQLVMDRNRDLDRTFAAGDFDGVAENLYQDGAVISDEDVAMFRNNIAAVYIDYQDVNFERVPRKSLARDLGSDSKPQTIHELGSWVTGGDVARYTRWVYSGEPYGWQIETDVDTHNCKPTQYTDCNATQPGDHTDAIRERYTAYSKLFEAGNFSGLVADLYTNDAVLALMSGSFVERDNLENALRQIYDADPQREFVVSTAEMVPLFPTADVVHDIGTVTTNSHKYYARWEKSGEEWKIAVQVQVGEFTATTTQPPDDQTCAAHSACSELEGNCCPTDEGVTLDCCGAALCSSHPECAGLGLAGNCCPDDAGLQLDCCSPPSVSV